MAEHDDEREASRAYRQLPREEPPASIDARIRAEARSAIETHPAPLVPPTGRRQWYFPLAAAAVIVLAVAVTWQVERVQPDPMVASAPQVKQEMQRQQAKAPPVPQALPERRDLPRDRIARNEAPPAAPQASERQAPSGFASGALAKLASPESELERIAELRRQGKDEEADKALAEFRKRYPDYRIAPEMLKRVEKK